MILAVLALAAPLQSLCQNLGGEISYHLKDNKTLEVELTVYSQVNSDSKSYEVVYLNSEGSTKSDYINIERDAVVDITSNCLSGCSNTNGKGCDYPYSVFKKVYKTTYDLSEKFTTSDCKIKLYWRYYNSQTRSNTYISSSLDRCLTQKNTSPEFRNLPNSQIAGLQIYSYDHGAVDEDGDSLYYSLVPSLLWNGVPKRYNSGATYDAPFDYLGYPNKSGSYPTGFNFNNATGHLQFVPTKEETERISVKVEEYRNGDKIGEIIRDVSHTVFISGNKVPYVSGVNGGTKEEIVACEGQELCFNINVSDPNKNDDVDISFDHNLPNAKISETEVNGNSVLKVCWTAKKEISSANRADRYFRVRATDDGCDLNLSFDRTIKIRTSQTPSVKITQNIIGCGEVKLSSKPEGRKPSNYTYKWSVSDQDVILGRVADFDLGLPGSYPIAVQVTDKANGCKTEHTSIVEIPQRPVVSAGADLDVCPKDEFSLSATISSTTDIKNITWVNVFDPNQRHEQEITLTTEQDEVYELRIEDEHGCVVTDNVSVKLRDVNITAASLNPIVCTGTVAEIQLSGGLKYSWTGGNERANSTSDILIAKVNVVKDVTLVFNGVDENNCTAEVSVPLFADDDCVWPGDADGDGFVNNHDILWMGLAYNLQGPKPEEERLDFDWSPRRAPDWDNSFFTNNRNYKHADANNDGKVNSADLEVFDFHYGKEVPLVASSGKTDPEVVLKLVFSKTNVKAGDSVEITVYAGSESKPVKNVTGIAFSVDYTEYIKGDKVIFDTENSWLKGESNSIEITKVIHEDGAMPRIDVGFSRTDKKGVSGWGIIGKLKFVVEDNVNLGKPPVFELILSDASAVRTTGKLLEAGGDDMNLNIEYTTGAPRLIESQISVYPNPSNGRFNLHIPTEIASSSTLEILDALGNIVLTRNQLSDTEMLDLGQAKGCYIIRLTSPTGQAIKRVVIE